MVSHTSPALYGPVLRGWAHEVPMKKHTFAPDREQSDRERLELVFPEQSSGGGVESLQYTALPAAKGRKRRTPPLLLRLRLLLLLFPYGLRGGGRSGIERVRERVDIWPALLKHYALQQDNATAWSSPLPVLHYHYHKN